MKKWWNTSNIFLFFTGERYQFLYNFLILLSVYGQWLIPPIGVHQGFKITGDIMYKIKCNCIVHTTTSGYMNHGRWFKSIAQPPNMCGLLKNNNQIQLCYVQSIHFNTYVMDIIVLNHMHTFILKEYNSKDDQLKKMVQMPSSSTCKTGRNQCKMKYM